MTPERQTVLRPTDANTELLECPHHWVIDTPQGPVSHGLCKRCGEEREFQNYLESPPPWEEDVSPSPNPLGLNLAQQGIQSNQKDDTES